MVQCFYGEEEADSLCPDPVAAGTERVRTSGGHHFDGDYARLAGIILAGAIRRAGER
jgi:type IV secretory pathway VirJ component